MDLREVFNALSYVSRASCHWFVSWNDDLRVELRQAEGPEAEPSDSIIDSQSVKTTEVAGERGYDAGKKVNGRNHHALVDMLGRRL